MTNDTIDRYEMYTDDGNQAVANAVDALAEKMRNGTVTRPQLDKQIRLLLNHVEKSHPEVHDTEPEWAICDEINKVCDELMWKHTDRWEW